MLHFRINLTENWAPQPNSIKFDILPPKKVLNGLYRIPSKEKSASAFSRPVVVKHCNQISKAGFGGSI